MECVNGTVGRWPQWFVRCLSTSCFAFIMEPLFSLPLKLFFSSFLFSSRPVCCHDDPELVGDVHSYVLQTQRQEAGLRSITMAISSVCGNILASFLLCSQRMFSAAVTHLIQQAFCITSDLPWVSSLLGSPTLAIHSLAILSEIPTIWTVTNCSPTLLYPIHQYKG